MNLFEYLKIALRRRYFLFFFILISGIISFLYVQNTNKPYYQNTIFISFSSNLSDESNLPYILNPIETTDYFTESVQGWFLSPGLNNRINSNLEQKISLSSIKQEKQNLLLTYQTEQQSTENPEIIKQELEKDLSKFNSISDLDFSISLYDFHQQEIKPNLFKSLIIYIILSIVIGYLLALAYELVFRKLNSKDQIKQIFRKDIYACYKSSKDFKLNNNFLLQKLKNDLENYNALEIFNLTNSPKFGIETISKAKLFDKIVSIDIPKELEKINPKAPTLIITQMGFTNLHDLEQLSKLSLTKLEIVIIDQI